MNEQLNRRLAFLGVLIVGLFAALFTRAWYLQVLTADELSENTNFDDDELLNFDDGDDMDDNNDGGGSDHA